MRRPTPAQLKDSYELVPYSDFVEQWTKYVSDQRPGHGVPGLREAAESIGYALSSTSNDYSFLARLEYLYQVGKERMQAAAAEYADIFANEDPEGTAVKAAASRMRERRNEVRVYFDTQRVTSAIIDPKHASPQSVVLLTRGVMYAKAVPCRPMHPN